MKRTVGILAGLALLAAPVLFAEAYKDTEYISGHAGYANKIKGTLVIEERGVSFLNHKGGVIFSIPAEQIVKATDANERSEGSFGRKMALGIFASKNEEFLTVETRSANNAEAVIFKCKRKTAPGMAAKINFQVSKLKPEPKPQ